MSEITGTLKNARRYSAQDDHRGPCLNGDIHGDVRGRFRDGTNVTTSTIVEELPDNVFKTRNSTYRVETWAE